MPKRVDRERRQAELLESAVALFAERGYQATTMDEIAERAGVSKGTLYLYFKNKEALFGAVFRWFGRMTGERMIAAVSGCDDEVEQLRRIAAAWAGVAVEYRDYVPLFLDFWAAASLNGMRSDYAEELEAIYRENRTMLVALIERGVRAGRIKADVDPQAVAYLLVGGMDGMYIQSWLSHTDDIAALMVEAMERVIDGIVA